MELDGKFEVEDGYGGERDPVLAKLGVETFLIIPPKQDGSSSATGSAVNSLARRSNSYRHSTGSAGTNAGTNASGGGCGASASCASGGSGKTRPKKMECWGADKPFANITENNLTAKSIAITTLSMIESNILPNRRSCCDSANDELLPWVMGFRSLETELEYQRQPDTNFPHYISCVVLLFAFLVGIQFVLLPSSSLMFLAWTPTGLVLLFFLALTLTQNATLRKVESISRCCEGLSGFTHDSAGDIIAKNHLVRLLLFALVTFLLSACTMVVLLDAKWAHDPSEALGKKNETSLLSVEDENATSVFTAPLYPQVEFTLEAALMSCALCLIGISVFLHVNFLLKLVVMVATVVSHTVVFFLCIMPQHQGYFLELYPWPCWLSASLSACFLCVLLHLLDRQAERASRTDFLWRTKLSSEEEGVDTMRGINKILLENILPAHVAEHYLLQVRGMGQGTQDETELYNERYENIAVMFASIPNYKEFYDENDINKQGLECLRLLNEIICDFDKLLSKPKFSVLEKIKTIGSTYMVAAGLQPGKEGERATLREHHYCAILVEFAVQLMTLLEHINRDSFQRFRLRAGLNQGCVVAGVVGAQKPQYDIWGNTVNVASRMESTGEMGRIQVTEETAQILMTTGYECQCRGPIFVKGKGMITTYFVKTPFDTK